MQFGVRLRQERVRRHLSQEALAEAIGVSPRSIRRWEQGQVLPQPSVRSLFCRFFTLPPEVLFSTDEEQNYQEEVWSAPYPRNPFFTGREEILFHLRELLTREHMLTLTQSLAINGLGGIGKTQIALEYAYQYRQDYRFVFWSSAATREGLQANIITIAERLQLPEWDEQDQAKVIHTVKRWFANHGEWLWIIDNADDIEMVRDIIPTERLGHLLFTSRAQAWGSMAQQIEITTMGMAEGTLFLLRRAKLLGPDTFLDQIEEKNLAAAENIVTEMAFLPLALDQAGAYIEEIGCSLLAYLDLYRTHRKELLQRQGHVPTDYPETVATTWSLNFQKVEQANPAAADLLRLCAFLEPDTIHEELIRKGSAHLGPVLGPVAMETLKLNEAIKELREFSLLQRHPETRVLQVHRLVQAVLKDTMKGDVQRQWAERAVYATNAMFPEEINVTTLPRCRSSLPQAQACSILIQDYTFTFAEAAALLFRTAAYLQLYVLYEQAELLYQQVLHIREQTLGPEHHEIAIVLYHLGDLQRELGRVQQAESLYQQALRIYEQTPGTEHLKSAMPLIGLARLSSRQGEYEHAELLFHRALRIREQALGPEHADIAEPLAGLARLSYRQGKYEQAELLSQQALHIYEQTLGPEHLETTVMLNSLGTLYYEQGKYEQAEALYLRVLHIREQTLEPEHREVASVLTNLATVYRDQGDYGKAEPLFQRAVRIWEHTLGPEHMDLSFGLHNLAELYSVQKMYEQAEPLFQRALSILEHTLKPDHPFVTYPLNGLANLYRDQGKTQQAESLYQRALSIRENHELLQHPDTAQTLYDFAMFWELQGKGQQAVPFYQQALVIWEQALGSQHARTIDTRERLKALSQ